MSNDYEDNKIMIVKTDRDRTKATIKVTRKVKNSFAPKEYFKIVNLHNYQDLALFFEDLDMILNAPVERAFRNYKEKKEKGFPF
jgi:beta-lactamase class D